MWTSNPKIPNHVYRCTECNKSKAKANTPRKKYSLDSEIHAAGA